jgi:hypothetical protein
MPGVLDNLLVYTPVGDLLKGRITCRLDWRTPVQQSGLPPDLKRRLIKLLTRSGLWRVERAELARQLAEEWAASLAAGQTVQGLLDEMGSLRRQARQIRRSRVRQRPIALRTLSVVVRVMAIVLLMKAGVWLWRFMQVPQPQVNYLAQINATALAVPEQDRAWPIYREVILAHLDAQAQLNRLRDDEWRHGDWRAAPADDPHIQQLHAWVTRHQTWVEGLRQAAAKPAMGLTLAYPWNWPERDRQAAWGSTQLPPPPPAPATPEQRLVAEMLVSMPVPLALVARQQFQVLALDMEMATRRGDGERVIRDLRAGFGMARQVRQMPLSIYQVVSGAMTRGSLEHLLLALHRDAAMWSDEQLADLSRLVEGTPSLLVPDVRMDHLMVEDLVQRAYTDDGRGSGQITWHGMRTLSDNGLGFHDLGNVPRWVRPLLSVAWAPVLASRAELLAEHTRWVREDHRQGMLPTWAACTHRDALMADFLSRFEQWDHQTRYWLLGEWYWAPFVATSFADQFSQVRKLGEVTGVCLALERYRRANGEYPRALEDLSPQWLPALPRDAFAEGLVRYRLEQGKPLLYSRGLGGRDHGGTCSSLMRRNWSARPNHPDDGDWIFFPPAIGEWSAKPRPAATSVWQH